MANFDRFSQEEKDAMARALGEYVQGRWGDTGAYLKDDGGLEDPCTVLLAGVLRAGAAPDPYMRDLAARVRRMVPRA